MMAQISSNLRVSVRPVAIGDQQRLASLMHFEHQVHRHLDWIPPLEHMDKQPFFVLEQEGQVHAALMCPIDPPGVSWIRLFIASGSVSGEAAWQLLWSETRRYLRAEGSISVVAIALHKWMSEILGRSKFRQIQDVVFLTWNLPKNFNLTPHSPNKIRPMRIDDLPSIEVVDKVAFDPIWRNSLSSLTAAFEQSYIATVLEDEHGIFGYQISTAGHMGGHLARLAVHPQRQGQKWGFDLLVDTLRKFQDVNIHKVSVNTQQNNIISLNLYHKVGFINTGETYGVYEFVVD